MTSKLARADPVAIADADLVIGEPLDGEVLAELSVDEVVSSELAFPVPIRVDLVDEHRALLAAVPRAIALTVALDVELADSAPTLDWILEDAGEDGLPLPRHVLRHADVDRQQLPTDFAESAAASASDDIFRGVSRGEGTSPTLRRYEL